MAREFAKDFYKSDLWERTRRQYIAHVGGLCEDCLAEGIYTPGVIVHHIEHLSPANIGDLSKTVSFSNLRLVCRDCHGAEHHTAGSNMRYFIDKQGNILPKGADLQRD